MQTSATTEYFLEIDRYYRGRRGPGALLSRVDLDCIDRWGREGLPLDVVLEGLQLAFDRAGSRIRGIAYCEGFIAEALEVRGKRRCSYAHPEPPEVPRSAIRTYLDELARRAEAPGVDGLVQITRAIRELDESRSFRELEQELGRLESAAVEVLRAAAPVEVLGQVRAAVDSDVRLFRETMTAEQLGNFEQNLWRRKLLEHFLMPRLSLFYLL